MLRSTLRAAALAAALLILSAVPGRAQVVASISAAEGSALAVGPDAGCWGCWYSPLGSMCTGGHVPGYWTCVTSWVGCYVGSPGCGAGAALPVDPDGASQFVTRSTRPGLIEVGDGEVRTNCEGVVVARRQTMVQIDLVRARTGSLSL
jgi:hypothetical protein